MIDKFNSTRHIFIALLEGKKLRRNFWDHGQYIMLNDEGYTVDQDGNKRSQHNYNRCRSWEEYDPDAIIDYPIFTPKFIHQDFVSMDELKKEHKDFFDNVTENYAPIKYKIFKHVDWIAFNDFMQKFDDDTILVSDSHLKDFMTVTKYDHMRKALEYYTYVYMYNGKEYTFFDKDDLDTVSQGYDII